MTTCGVSDCGHQATVRGCCLYHYERARRGDEAALDALLPRRTNGRRQEVQWIPRPSAQRRAPTPIDPGVRTEEEVVGDALAVLFLDGLLPSSKDRMLEVAARCKIPPKVLGERILLRRQQTYQKPDSGR